MRKIKESGVSSIIGRAPGGRKVGTYHTPKTKPISTAERIESYRGKPAQKRPLIIDQEDPITEENLLDGGIILE